MKKHLPALIICLLIPQLIGAVGAWATSASVETWYAEIDKPWFTPPGFVFPIVWPLLYGMMGVASWMVWKRRGVNPLADTALWVYGFHLVLNFLWSFLFFGLQQPGLAFGEILLLWAMIALTMYFFYLIRPAAGLLLAPYLVWVSFAAVLNGTIWWMNL